MNLNYYISQALYRYPCVVVPDFGAFVTEIVSAKLSEFGQHLSPPHKKVLFNPLILNNDGLLAQLYCVGENCAYDLALQKIEAQVAYWKLQFEQNSVLVLEQIGEISKKDGKYAFSQNHEENYLADSFGLATFHSPLIKREIPTLNKEIIADVAPVVVSEASQITVQAKKSNHWYKYAAVFFLGLGALTLGYFGNIWYQDKIERETQMANQIAQEKVEERLQKATFFLPEKLLPITLNVSAPTDGLAAADAYEVTYFHVVGGAFKSIRNANKEVQNLTKMGFKSRIGGKNKYGYFLVLLESFKSKQDAQEALNHIILNVNEEAWILAKPL